MRYMASCQSMPKRMEIKTTFIRSPDRPSVHKSSFSILFSTANAANRNAEQAIAMRSGINWEAVALPSLFKKRPINGAATKTVPTKHIIKKTVILPAHFDLL